jgi:uncharacterized membrane protein YfcA
LLGYGQKEATGTSLAAISVIGVLAAAGHALYGNVDLWKGVLISIPAVAGVVAGTWRQREYGNVRLCEGLLVGILSPLGVLAGVALANAFSERVLELSFAAVQLVFAWQLAKKAGLR